MKYEINIEFDVWLYLASYFIFCIVFLILNANKRKWNTLSQKLVKSLPFIVVPLSLFQLSYGALELLHSIPSDFGQSSLIPIKLKNILYSTPGQTIIYLTDLVISFYAYLVFSAAVLFATLRDKRKKANYGFCLTLALLSLSVSMLLGLAKSLFHSNHGISLELFVPLELLISLGLLVTLGLIMFSLLRSSSDYSKQIRATKSDIVSMVLIFVLPFAEPMLGNAFQILAFLGVLLYLKRKAIKRFNLEDMACLEHLSNKLAAAYLMSYCFVTLFISLSIPLIDSTPSLVFSNKSLVVVVITPVILLLLLSINLKNERASWIAFGAALTLDFSLRIFVLSLEHESFLTKNFSESLVFGGITTGTIVFVSMFFQLIALLVLTLGVEEKSVRKLLDESNPVKIFRGLLFRKFLMDTSLAMLFAYMSATVSINILDSLQEKFEEKIVPPIDHILIKIDEVTTRLKDESKPVNERIDLAREIADQVRSFTEVFESFQRDSRVDSYGLMSVFCLLFFWWSVWIVKEIHGRKLIRNSRSYLKSTTYRELVKQIMRSKKFYLQEIEFWRFATAISTALCFLTFLFFTLTAYNSLSSAVDSLVDSRLEAWLAIINTVREVLPQAFIDTR